MDFTMTKGSIFARSLHKIKSKLSLWKAPLLSFASRLILVKHNHSIALRFLWFGEKGKGLVWKNWAACCLPKSKEGLGIKDFGCLNQAIWPRWLGETT